MWTVADSNAFDFPNRIVEFREPVGARHPLPKEADPVDYSSHLSSNNENSVLDILERQTVVLVKF